MSYDFVIFGPPAPTTYDEGIERYLEACQGDLPYERPTAELADYRDWLVARWPSLADSAEEGDEAASGRMLMELGPPANMMILLCSWQDNAIEELGVTAVNEAVRRGLSMLNPQIERLFDLRCLPDGIGSGEPTAEPPEVSEE